MLKGQQVLTSKYLGTVLNDAEHEPCVIIQVVRERFVFQEAYTDMVHGRYPTWYKWRIVRGKRVAIPWREVGEIQLCPRIPKWLHQWQLYRRPKKGSTHAELR